MTQPIAGDAAGKNLLSMHQLTADDIATYLDEAYAAERVIRDPSGAASDPAPGRHEGDHAATLHPDRRQLYLGDAQARRIRRADQRHEQLVRGEGRVARRLLGGLRDPADILGIRTAENGGPAFAAYVIAKAAEYGQLGQVVPVINLGDGHNEHPTQALGDVFTVHKKFNRFEGLAVTVVGDQERYRAHHSLMIGAATLGMHVVAVESPAARVPRELSRSWGPG